MSEIRQKWAQNNLTHYRGIIQDVGEFSTLEVVKLFYLLNKHFREQQLKCFSIKSRA